MYFGPILRHVRVKLGVLFGNLRFCWAYIGPLRAYVRPYNVFGQLEGLSWAYLGPSGHIGSFQGYVGPIWGHVRKKNAFFLHGSSIFEFFGAMLHAAFGMCDVQKTL